MFKPCLIVIYMPIRDSAEQEHRIYKTSHSPNLHKPAGVEKMCGTVHVTTYKNIILVYIL